ncbi:CoA transferase [Asanoa sp. WMMD1127]|uniref:CaiB/BaiF CoA transferase family protein n=1 Tax=Asanoa sp. WMMD1127 TaxID=3016107 RepID=UPI0024179D52|nr:CoA transferase [Asanoa sp. WMMD1127]MDG4825238.1 CoA transferase [Asanoa sp. WMMD1127]
MADRPLRGVRVLDLTNVLAGPYCSYQLMLLGAEVVKVERPGQGDLARRLGPDPALNENLVGASFLAQNAGKKSIELDLKALADRARFDDLVRESDVLLENFRAGVLDRMGYGWDVLHAANPRLVYCAISGFGQTGPMSQAPAYDQIIQGLSGMMSITGTPDTVPLRVGFPVSDSIGGLVAAMSICAALAGRARTGEGVFLDVSMLEASLSAMGWAASNYLVSGVAPEPMGDQNATAAPSGTFDAADGPLNIAANRQEQFEVLCRLVRREDLLTDERFADREARKAHRAALNRELNAALRHRPAVEWEDLLSRAGVPAARILTVPQAVQLEQLRSRGFFTDLPFPTQPGRTLRVSGNGVLVNGAPCRPTTPPPLLGEHNDPEPAPAVREVSGR